MTVLAAALVLGGGVTAGIVLTAREPPRPVQAGPADDETGVIASVSDAGFTFDVTRVRCGFDRMATSEGETEAEGMFCLARLDITNDQAERVQLDLSCQHLVDADGRRHDIRVDATIDGTDRATRLFLVLGIPPGDTMEDGRLIFDVPKGAVEAGLELRGTCDSPGIVVTL